MAAEKSQESNTERKTTYAAKRIADACVDIDTETSAMKKGM